jgi:hypothetical protein
VVGRRAAGSKEGKTWPTGSRTTSRNRAGGGMA